MLAWLLSPVLLGSMLVAQAWAFDEGIDYTRLVQPQPTETGEQVEVLEVFWYGCPHCWHLEPALDAWLESLPEGAAFRRMPATGGRWDAHARAFYAAQAMGKLDVFHKALFRAIHEEKRELMTEDDLAGLAGEAGLDEAEFRADYASFLVETQLRKAKEMATRYGIDSVPTIIIDGKYRTGPSQAGGQARMFEVLDTLLEQELQSGS
ncbi:thiol:disulfide interchange protein DsbA/DsbL [Thiorhodococcus minor]|uniref:Thiol:disulfide interchange protein n=1 Tax=Thiorhodococcus minor TaxID=57489 RepID=A0A6M0K302_9GAMM|nr:thiol:disulfide interchange protein DsbA/DsbL [Thiorhodococcus minor]NEV62977.1 thiol:disulfide interchange protein DsbA/DsbL [Thiorhodococcus minor]